MKRIQFVFLIFVVLFTAIQQTEGQLSSPSVFAVRGVIYAADGVTPAGDGLNVTVENITKELRLGDTTGTTAGPSQYVVTFVDFNTQIVEPGDVIQATVTQGPTGEVLATKEVSVGQQDISAGFLMLDINFTSSSSGNYVFAILGTILLSDNTPAGDGLTVTVDNLSKGIRHTDVTGKYAGPSRYVTTFVNTRTPVADVGDEIEVSVADVPGHLLGSRRVVLSADSTNTALEKIDVILSPTMAAGINVFALRGTVFMSDGTTLAGNGFRVTVENLSKNLSQTSITGAFAGPSQYVTTFVNTTHSVAEVGDMIEVRVKTAGGGLVGKVETQLTSDAINAGFAVIDVALTSTPGTQVFIIRGTVLTANGEPAEDGLQVTVENLNKGLSQTSVTGTFAGPGQYVIIFIDIENPVVEVGDEIEIRVEDAEGNPLGQSRTKLTADVINVGAAEVGISPSPPVGTQVFVVRGMVFAYDDVTPAGDGLKVTVKNVSKNLTETDITGETAGSGQYAVTFVSTEQDVASPGDTIEVQVSGAAVASPLGTETILISQSDIAQGFVAINIAMPSLPWDSNADKIVDIGDLVQVGKQFGQEITEPLTPNPDINRDGIVDILDLVIIARNFGKSYVQSAK